MRRRGERISRLEDSIMVLAPQRMAVSINSNRMGNTRRSRNMEATTASHRSSKDMGNSSRTGNRATDSLLLARTVAVNNILHPRPARIQAMISTALTVAGMERHSSITDSSSRIRHRLSSKGIRLIRRTRRPVVLMVRPLVGMGGSRSRGIRIRDGSGGCEERSSV